MSAATASIADVSRTDNTKKDAERKRKKSGQSQAQCSPVPLPTLGTQKIIQGNGTNVGTIISLQCPAKHKLVGSELKCVMATNSTHWVGETYCKPLSLFEDYGFRVAVLASIVSLAIIFLMSMAFITCCLLDCIKEDERKKQESELDAWQWEEQAQHQEENRSHCNNKGRNNNNNTQEEIHSLWDTHNPLMCDSMPACRCHQEYDYGAACTNSSTSSFAALPGQDYDQPLLPRNPQSVPISVTPQYPGAHPFSCQTANPGVVRTSAMRPDMWQHEEQQRHLSGVNLSPTDESNTRNINPTKEFSIRIISV